MKKLTLSLMLLLLTVLSLLSFSFAGGNDLRIGFIYVGPVGDTGWNYTHARSRHQLVKNHPEIETIAVASVGPEDAANVMETMIDQGAKVIFATSWDFGPAVKTLAKKYPKIHFFHCSGIESGHNITTYFGRMYEAIYLSGALAALTSKNNKLGFIGPKIIPETIRHLNAFIIGAKGIKPDIAVEVAWTGSWYAPEKASQIARGFVKQGVDVYFSGVDSAAPLQIAMDKGVFAIGNNSDLSKFAPKNILTSSVWNWNVFYDRFLPELQKGTMKGIDIWWGMDRKAVGLAPFSALVPERVMQRIEKLKAAIIKGELSVFEGPLFDHSGTMRIKQGASASDKELRGMDWPVYGVQANLPAPKIDSETIKAYIVQSYEYDNVCGVPQGEGIKHALKEQFKDKTFIKTHYMNTKTIHADPEKMRADAALVLEEIENFNPDIVFTVDDNSFREVGLKLEGKSFPVVFTGVNGQPQDYNKKVIFLDKKSNPVSNITGIYEKLHFRTCLRVMKGVLPELKKVVVLMDKSPTGKAVKIQIEKEIADNKREIEIVFRHVDTVKEYIREIRNINKDPSIKAVYPVVLSVKDDSGKYVGSGVTLKEFLKNSVKPGMAVNFIFTRLGIFGGASVDFTAMGRQAGQMGVRLLRGEKIQKLPIESAREYSISFNKARADMLGIVIPDEIIGAAKIYNTMALLPGKDG